MFCTQLRTLLDDVCRGLDGQLRSLPTRFMLTLDPSELEVTLGCFFAMHANFGLGPIRLGPIRHRAAFDSFPLLLWSRRVRPLGVLGGCCSFIVLLIKALVTTLAFAFGMIHGWGLCRFFL